MTEYHDKGPLSGYPNRLALALRLRTNDVFRLATTQPDNGLIERGRDQLGLVGARRVVGVAHRRLDVAVSHPLLAGKAGWHGESAGAYLVCVAAWLRRFS